MNTSDVLNKAADHIQRFGHMKGDGFGEGPVLMAPACIIGAIGVATDFAVGCDESVATGSVRNYLGGSVVAWNDAPERTAAEVIEVLRACAVIEQAREEQDAAWATYSELVTP